MSNFSFCQNVFKCRLQQGRQKASVCWKGYTLNAYLNCLTNPTCLFNNSCSLDMFLCLSPAF